MMAEVKKRISCLRERIFSDEIINGGRQPELDLAKAVVIVCLALVHCTIECTDEEGLLSGLPYLFDSVIGGPLSAPMLMFAMGIGMAYTRKNAPANFVRRGVRLEVLSYLLNICRFLLPFLAGYLITGEYERYMGAMPYRVLGNDIMQFAGLAMLLMGFLLWLKISKTGLFFTALAMSVASFFCNGIDVGHPLGNIFLGYLVGTEDAAGRVFSDFPLLNWFIVPVCGYLFGGALRHVKDKKLFYGVFSGLCGIFTVVYFAVGIHFELGMFGEGQNCYYHITPWDAAAGMSAAVAVLGVYWRLIRYIPYRFMRLAWEISCNINAVYCIHWVLIGWIVMVGLYAVRGTELLPVPVTMLLGVSISITAVVIAHFWSTVWKEKLLGGIYGEK